MQHEEHIEHIDMAKEEAKPSFHGHHAAISDDQRLEYMKFAGLMVAILFGAFMHYTTFDLSGNGFMDSFMGVFFLTFASFKLIGLQDFVAGFRTYDIIARRYAAYGYTYPFIQLFFAGAYLIGANRIIDSLVLIVSLVSAYGVIQAINSHRQFHCVCLGNVIKLPLSRISFVEDFGMALMALVLLLTR